MINGIAVFNFMSFLPILLQFFTGTIRLRNLYESIVPVSTDSWDTNSMQLLDKLDAYEPNMGLEMMGSVVEMDPFASPVK